MKQILTAGLALLPSIALAAAPAPTVEALQKEIATLRAQNTVCSADLSRVMQDRVGLVETVAGLNAELTKKAEEVKAAEAGWKGSPKGNAVIAAPQDPKTTVPSAPEPPSGARR